MCSLLTPPYHVLCHTLSSNGQAHLQGLWCYSTLLFPSLLLWLQLLLYFQLATGLLHEF